MKDLIRLLEKCWDNLFLFKFFENEKHVESIRRKVLVFQKISNKIEQILKTQLEILKVFKKILIKI